MHAVQQPLGRPEWIRLPVVHHPEAPVAVPSLDNKFWKVTAWRYAGSHTAVLLGALQIHGASTAAIDIEAALDRMAGRPGAAGADPHARAGRGGPDPARVADGRRHLR